MPKTDRNTAHNILQATAELLIQSNGKGVRMGDIAKAAGISRQAVYLHYSSRTELLEATTKFIDEQLGLPERLAPSRNAPDGVTRLARYIAMWGEYIPEIYPTAKALLLAMDTDEAAADAWRDRMQDMREGCEAAIRHVEADGRLAAPWTVDTATDMLWTLLSVRNWELLVQERGWEHAAYTQHLQDVAKKTFVETLG
ncbi:TetR/AcrR family transcriptional regulator [Acanthopleuribacter pedis]|uniref:TetR/AcrR family transcriptional regulator n=1 Tax=Acanthopleuribacter pedis TaxID=442870 RepID=A0A8J7QC68_9BACT|nr:TetR/AcrR family transcriptional regulator [Acanthopleuribacter pedis]MBO1321747.1 TetR/AcrR family transcriptional regulator [Acanthopleuribacter pedis]